MSPPSASSRSRRSCRECRRPDDGRVVGCGAWRLRQTGAHKMVNTEGVDSFSERLRLHPFTVEEARRVVDRRPNETDRWALDYPFEDELDALRRFVANADGPSAGHPFTLYRIDELSTGRAVGGLGFFGRPDADGVAELGYGLVPSARGQGFATEALRLALVIAESAGAKRVVADTSAENLASQKVLLKAGFVEQTREGDLLFYAIELLRD